MVGRTKASKNLNFKKQYFNVTCNLKWLIRITIIFMKQFYRNLLKMTWKSAKTAENKCLKIISVIGTGLPKVALWHNLHIDDSINYVN